ncbi:MAG: radical SAM protein [Candidatus Omnitrophota bacterium]
MKNSEENSVARKVILIRAGDSGERLPHALLSLASMLKDEVLILDQAAPADVRNHKEALRNAVCVGISTITGPHIKHSLEVAREIRRINPETPLVWGGWHPSLKPEQTLKSDFVDTVIVGQGEKAFADLVENIKNGKRSEDIISYPYADKATFPVYDFSLLDDVERYIIPTYVGSLRYVPIRQISLFSSQGCPFGCTFCAIESVYGKHYSGWPIEAVADLVQDCIKKYRINSVLFDDDNFFIGKKRALEFAEILLKRGMRINWSSDARVDTLCSLSPSEWELLDRSGCKWMLIGAESGAQATLDRLNKKITPEMILNLGRLCRRYNIVPSFSMMVGAPGETDDDIDKTFALIDTLKAEAPSSELLLFLYTPYPGTPLYDLSLEMGFKEPGSLEEWSELYLDIPTVPWVKSGLVERVRRYNRSIPVHRDIGLKHTASYSYNPSIHFKRFRYLLYRSGKMKKSDALLRYIGRKMAGLKDGPQRKI